MTWRRAATALMAVLALALVLVVVVGRPRGPLVAALLAAALGVVLVLRYGRGPRVILLLLLLPTIVQFHAWGARLGGDGVMYYVYVRSLWKDADIDFTNEYAHYEMLDRTDLRVPTKTGRRRSIFAVGPALVWSPFFLAAEGLSRALDAFGVDTDRSGYGPVHLNAVALGSLICGWLAVVVIYELLRRHFREGDALGAAILVWLAGFLYWYMVHQPTMAHAVSALGAAVALWLWARNREARTPAGFLVLGLVLGFAMCLRWQNGVLLVLPAFDLAGRLRRGDLRGVALPAAALVAGAAIGAIPQMATWKLLYGEWLLRHPPHGADFLRLDRPFVLETLFSSRHGLLSWTPVFWAAFFGFLPLLRTRPRIGGPLALPLVLMTYVNMCSGDWWAGGSFSIRRFDSLLPILAFGCAALLEWARRFVTRHPQTVTAALAVPLTAWTFLLWAQARRGEAGQAPVAFSKLVGGGVRLVSESVGSPTTWPASWIFAWREKRPPSQYDLLVGRYLFYRQNNLAGLIDLGVPGDEAFLGEGWSAPAEHQGASGRQILAPARVLAALDLPEALEVRVRAAGPGTVTLRVNGRAVGTFPSGGAWAEHALLAPAPFWRRDLNDVVLDPGPARVWVDAVRFQALPAEGPLP